MMNPELMGLIAHAEGFRAEPYICPAGYPTIGYGHRIPTMDHVPIDEKQADAILMADIEQAALQAHGLCPNLTGRRLDALTDLIFNVGLSIDLVGSGLVKALRAGQWADAAARFRRWDKARVKGELVELPGLKARRETGAQWIESG